MYDVIIIGAGVSGSAIARELSRYELNVCVLEKEVDVCCGTSKANSGIVHGGYDAEHGTLKAKLNKRGNDLMEDLCKKLDIPFVRNGSLVVATEEKDIEKLEALLENGQKNGVEGLKIIDAEELKEKEPNISDTAVAALWVPTGGIVCPFELNLGMAENAHANGVEFKFSQKVTNVTKTENGFVVRTESDGEEYVYEAKLVINAAGVYADQISHMVSEKEMDIVPRRGDYFLLDKSVGNHVKSTIFVLPGAYGKGVLVTPTTHGNLLVGPTAIDIEDKEASNTTLDGLNMVRNQCETAVKNVPLNKVITTFAGLRAHEGAGDFIIEETEENFINCAGIASPGLSSCPAIGEYVAQMVVDKWNLVKKADFVEERKGILKPFELSDDELSELIKQNPDYSVVICRCEHVTEGEIREAIRRPLGAKTVDGVKRRTRAGMGRCQAGFCTPKVMEILAEELGISMLDVTKNGGDSRMLTGEIKEEL